MLCYRFDHFNNPTAGNSAIFNTSNNSVIRSTTTTTTTIANIGGMSNGYLVSAGPRIFGVSVPPHSSPYHHTPPLTTTLLPLPPHSSPYHHTPPLTTTLFRDMR
ncbi:hypothetical protein RRG08_030932 [Elysia crispata]|uniref:Uncharacterized protein n=1 Tax=Elysia crispata TaxID=231223 RepID=A0AAE1DV35_9GAST|nr:hypothetical protein RRG08_030932 [Elysia crispata]